MGTPRPALRVTLRTVPLVERRAEAVAAMAPRIVRFPDPKEAGLPRATRASFASRGPPARAVLKVRRGTKGTASALEYRRRLAIASVVVARGLIVGPPLGMPCTPTSSSCLV